LCEQSRVVNPLLIGDRGHCPRHLKEQTAMQASALLDIDTAVRDPAGPSIQAPTPTMPKPRIERANLLWRVVDLLRPAPKTAVSYHDPLFMEPDMIEHDYYRFRHYPSL
jgi:hypothetical protein